MRVAPFFLLVFVCFCIAGAQTSSVRPLYPKWQPIGDGPDIRLVVPKGARAVPMREASSSERRLLIPYVMPNVQLQKAYAVDIDGDGALELLGLTSDERSTTALLLTGASSRRPLIFHIKDGKGEDAWFGYNTGDAIAYSVHNQRFLAIAFYSRATPYLAVIFKSDGTWIQVREQVE